LETSRLLPLYRKLAAKCVPAKVRLELTRKCNLRCVHCKVVTRRRPRNELSTTDIHRIMPQLRDAGAFEINITGGEIFSRPDVLDLLSAILEHDFMITLTTNGTLLRRKHFDFLDAHRDRIMKLTVSMYAGAPGVHEAVTGVPGSFGKTLASVTRLQEMEFPFAVFCMLMKPNAAHWRETEKFFRDRGLIHQFGGLMISREDGCSHPLDLRVPDELLAELPIPWSDYLNPDPSSAPADYTADTPLSEWCIAGRFTTIMPNADVVVCSVIRERLGNLRETPFKDIWENSELLKYFRSLRAGDLDCFDCEYFPRCRPCIGLARAEQGSFTARPLEYCRLTKHYLAKYSSS